MAGIFYGWIGVYYGELAQMVDTWAYYYEAVKETEIIRSDPGLFFSTIFSNSYEHGYSGFLSAENSWWNDLKANFLIKIVAIFNLLSFSHYYTNIIFYSFLTLFGPIAIYRVMDHVFPTKKLAVLISTFLLPSFLYWTSGVHKEGLLFVAFALITYHLYFAFKEDRLRFYRVLVILFSLLLILILRNFLIIPLIPAIVAWFIAAKMRVKPVYSFAAIYAVFVILFFTARYINPNLDFPAAVVDRQSAFMALKGDSDVEVEALKPSFENFVKNAPQAFIISVVRPFPADVRHLLSFAAALEINLLLLLFVIFLFWRKNGVGFTPFILFSIFLSFSVLIMIGYSVNNLGAVVRYRSIVLPFLIIPMMAKINWHKLKNILLGNI
ncbi:MAG: hypothetical protein ACR2KB_13780 [Chitinophagaceae bacterium]